MVSRRPWILLLAATLSVLPLACSRETPPPPAAATTGAPEATRSSPLPPLQLHRRLRLSATSSAREYADFPASIPGVLAIHAPNLDSQSHGIGNEPWKATFLVTNESLAPLSVTVSGLKLRSDDAALAPADRTQTVPVEQANVDGVPVPVEDGTVTFTAPPRMEIGLELEGDLRQKLGVAYHVAYHHEATFVVGGARVVGHGYTMIFRHPHRP